MKFYPSVDNFTQALLVMLVTNITSENDYFHPEYDQVYNDSRQWWTYDDLDCNNQDVHDQNDQHQDYHIYVYIRIQQIGKYGARDEDQGKSAVKTDKDVISTLLQTEITFYQFLDTKEKVFSFFWIILAQGITLSLLCELVIRERPRG